MAVEDKIITQNATGVVADVGPGSLRTGGAVKCIPFSFEVAAADDDGSKYRIGQVPVNGRMLFLQRANDAIAGATSYQIGMYRDLTVGGALVDVDNILASTDINAGSATLVNVLPALDAFGKTFWQLAGLSAMPKYPTFDIVVTGATVGTAAGTICGLLWYVE